MSHQPILDFLDIGFERDLFDSAIRNLADEATKVRFDKIRMSNDKRAFLLSW